MAGQRQTVSLHLLQVTRGLLGKSSFNPNGCDALLTCADQLLVSSQSVEGHLEMSALAPDIVLTELHTTSCVGWWTRRFTVRTAAVQSGRQSKIGRIT
jgi:hypothetical protein